MAQSIVILTVHGTKAVRETTTAQSGHAKTNWRQRIAELFAWFFRRGDDGKASAAAKGMTDIASRAVGSDWWKPPSEFLEKLLQHLRAVGINPSIQSFEWSGANSGSEREGAAIALKRKLKKLTDEGSSVYLIGHSHGGNVIENALEGFGWRLVLWRWMPWKGRSSNILGAASVGTPFFRRRRPRTRWLVVLLFSLLWIVLALGTVLFAFEFIYSAFYEPEKLKGLPYWFPAAMGVMMLLLFAVLRSNAPFLLPRLPAEPSQGWLSIWHPHDEAISALQVMENSRLEFYAPGAIAKKVRLLFDSTIIYVLSAIAVTIATDKPGATDSLSSQIGSVLSAVLLLLILMRLSSGMADRLLRGPANGRMRQMLLSIAFGQDHYIRLSDVATKPWVYGGAEYKIPGELATRMRKSAEDALVEFVRANQAAVFLVGAAGVGGGKMPTDLMEKLTWRELVHTTYFNYDEIAGEIAQHVVKLAQAAALAKEPHAPLVLEAMPAARPSA